MSLGTVVEVIGAVVDVEFPRDSVPKVNDALKLVDSDLVLKCSSNLETELCVLLPWEQRMV